MSAETNGVHAVSPDSLRGFAELLGERGEIAPPLYARRVIQWVVRATQASGGFLVHPDPLRGVACVSAYFDAQSGQWSGGGSFPVPSPVPRTLGEWTEGAAPVDLPLCSSRCSYGWFGADNQLAALGLLDAATDETSLACLRLALEAQQNSLDLMRNRRAAGFFPQVEDALNRMDVGLLCLSPQGQVLHASRAALLRLGRPSEQAADLSFAEIAPQADAKRWSEIWDQLRRQPLLVAEVMLRRADGATFSADLRATRLQDGAAESAIVTFCDAARHDKTPHAEMHQRDALSHAMRLQTMGELVAAIAHEMTQPLSAIANFASACRTKLESGPLDERESAMVTKWIQSVIDQSHRAGGIIDRLRKFSRRSAPHRSTYDLNEVLHEAIRLHMGEAYADGVRVRTQLQPGACQVVIDEVQLHQVMANLLRNAFEATAANEHERWVVVQSEIIDGAIVVAIEDNGSGVDASIAERMYEPFETTRPDRMGVGLTTARSIIEAHHGRLWHAPNPARGTRFSFSLPLVEAPPVE